MKEVMEILKLLEAPGLIALMIVVFLLIKVIFRFMEITEKQGLAVQELTTWLKTRFKN